MKGLCLSEEESHKYQHWGIGESTKRKNLLNLEEWDAELRLLSHIKKSAAMK